MLSQDVRRLLPVGLVMLVLGVVWILAAPVLPAVPWAGALAPVLPWLGLACLAAFLVSQVLLIRGIPGRDRGGPGLTVMDGVWLAAPLVLVAVVAIWLASGVLGTAGA